MVLMRVSLSPILPVLTRVALLSASIGMGQVAVAQSGPLASSTLSSSSSTATVLQSSVARPVDPAARGAVVTAKTALNARQWDRLPGLAAQARGDVLAYYPEYWWLRQQLNNAKTDTPHDLLQKFLETHRGSYLEQRLRGDWIQNATRTGDHARARLLARDIIQTSPQIDCAILEARHAGGETVTEAQAVAAFTPGNACWALFDRLVARGVVQQPAMSQQIRGFLEANQTAHAIRMARYLLDGEERKQYSALIENPMQWLSRQSNRALTPQTREMAISALARLARKDMMVGYDYFQKNWYKRLPKEDALWVQSHFALMAGLRQNGVANRWYRATDGLVGMSDYNAEWRVRVALREPTVDWRWVQSAIQQMPESLRERPSWVYWQARGHAALGQQAQARADYSRIAGQFNYYGQLAAEELGLLTDIPPVSAPPTALEMAQARNHIGLHRSVELFRLGWRSEAVLEWNYALRGMNDRQLIAAAELARAEHLYDRVVNTSERTRDEHDFRQRFLAPFQGQVTAKAESIGLDPAWVYGLIRQESRFITEARSGVGASGLMQLMPATAKWVAKRIGMENFTPGRVNEFDVNTTLGTNYLNIVLQDLNGSQLLASAGYNAGPRRPHNWRATFGGPVEGAIFAETIPFAETRDYVQKVLSNATYYTALFTGQPQSLKDRLGTVVPQRDETTAVP